MTGLETALELILKLPVEPEAHNGIA